MDTIYLDHNATTQPAPEVVAAMTDALTTHWQNPSSVHRPGQAARQRLELARESVCRLINCRDRELIFTSGGSEAANLALRSCLLTQPDRRVLATCRTEHACVRDLAEALGEEEGIEIVWLEMVDGLVDLDALAELLRNRSDEIAAVSVMWANNETGVIQPIESIGATCREHGVRFHCDGTQWVGKMPTDVAAMPIDLMSFSAHKFHGPKGIGALYVRRGVRIVRHNIGGPQERDRRGGTENTPGIRGMGAAAELARAWLNTDECERMEAMRDRFERGIIEATGDAVVNGASVPRLWNTANIAFPRLEAEAILLLLSERGVCASAGAACSSGSLDPSPVLLAMGIAPEHAHGSVRFSLSRETTDAEIDQAVQIIPAVIQKLRSSLTVV